MTPPREIELRDRMIRALAAALNEDPAVQAILINVARAQAEEAMRTEIGKRIPFPPGPQLARMQ